MRFLFLLLFCVWSFFVCLAAGADKLPPSSARKELTRKLWPRQRILAALKQVDRLHQLGMMSNSHYRRKRRMLEQRLAGTFQPTMLATTNPPLNFIQNSGFEEINRNSRQDRSRWLWWNGWSWGGSYENHWESRPDYVHSGHYSARIHCTGATGRIGIFTPPIPVLPGVDEYEFSVWAKGEGSNRLFINFEAGASGSFRGSLSSQWRKIIVRGKLKPGAKSYRVFLYSIGDGTIWLDDACLRPVPSNSK